MKTLPVVEVSPRLEFSVSRNLTARFVEQWKRGNPHGVVVVRDLFKSHIPFVDLHWIGGAFTPREQHSPESAAAIKVSDDLVAEIKSADHILIGTPMYNFSIPAILKAYIDQIVRSGVTVSTAYEGMLKGKKATVILSTGGDFSPGAPFASTNMASNYLRQVLGFIGISDVNIILAVRTLAVDQGHRPLRDYVTELDGEILSAAAA